MQTKEIALALIAAGFHGLSDKLPSIQQVKDAADRLRLSNAAAATACLTELVNTTGMLTGANATTFTLQILEHPIELLPVSITGHVDGLVCSITSLPEGLMTKYLATPCDPKQAAAHLMHAEHETGTKIDTCFAIVHHSQPPQRITHVMVEPIRVAGSLYAEVLDLIHNDRDCCEARCPRHWSEKDDD